jgi:hypothetical protein
LNIMSTVLNKRVSARVTADERAELEALAAERSQLLSSVLREAVQSYLERRAAIAEEPTHS